MNTISKQVENKIIAGLKSNNRKVRNASIKDLCSEEWITYVSKAIQFGNRAHPDFEDIFQKSVHILVMNILSGKFDGTSRLSSYFYSICSNQSLKSNRDNKKYTIPVGQPVETVDPSMERKIIEEEEAEIRKKIYHELMTLLKNPCKDIIRYIKMGMTYGEIGEALNYKNPNQVKTQYARCRKKMRELVKSKMNSWR